MADRRTGQHPDQLLDVADRHLSDCRQERRSLRVQVPDSGLPQRRLLSGLSVVERLYPCKPHQQRRRQWKTEWRDGRPHGFQTGGAAADPGWFDRAAAQCSRNTVVSQFWDTNSVWIPLSNGTVQRVIFNDNLHPWRNQYMPGVRQWFQDASLFKFIKITEQMSLRLNVDFFNVFNHPNNPTEIGGDGVLLTRNSGSAA